MSQCPPHFIVFENDFVLLHLHYLWWLFCWLTGTVVAGIKFWRIVPGWTVVMTKNDAIDQMTIYYVIVEGRSQWRTCWPRKAQAYWWRDVIRRPPDLIDDNGPSPGPDDVWWPGWRKPMAPVTVTCVVLVITPGDIERATTLMTTLCCYYWYWRVGDLKALTFAPEIYSDDYYLMWELIVIVEEIPQFLLHLTFVDHIHWLICGVVVDDHCYIICIYLLIVPLLLMLLIYLLLIVDVVVFVVWPTPIWLLLFIVVDAIYYLSHYIVADDLTCCDDWPVMLLLMTPVMILIFPVMICCWPHSIDYDTFVVCCCVDDLLFVHMTLILWLSPHSLHCILMFGTYSYISLCCLHLFVVHCDTVVQSDDIHFLLLDIVVHSTFIPVDTRLMMCWPILPFSFDLIVLLFTLIVVIYIVVILIFDVIYCCCVSHSTILIVILTSIDEYYLDDILLTPYLLILVLSFSLLSICYWPLIYSLVPIDMWWRWRLVLLVLLHLFNLWWCVDNLLLKPFSFYNLHLFYSTFYFIYILFYFVCHLFIFHCPVNHIWIPSCCSICPYWHSPWPWWYCWWCYSEALVKL